MKDLKYLASFTIPLSAVISFYLQGYWSFFTPFYAFVVIPVFELLLPVDASNYNEEEKISKEKSALFDWLLYINIPIIYSQMVYVFATVAKNNLTATELVGMVISLGIVLATNGINVAHELGHRKSKAQQLLAKVLLVPSHYMHFFIEHNYGHHLHVGTKEDPATARLNQSVYSFWFTSSFKQYFKAWKIQLELLERNKTPFLSFKNNMLWFTIIQAAYVLLVAVFFGLLAFGVALFAGVVSILMLETVNYIEHYGLLRTKLPSGRYERVRQKHSWNSNHYVGRIVLYELTRHSDHHFKSSKKYQVLECHDIAPQMPYGYPTSMVISFFPPLWFAIMNKRVPLEMKEAFAAL